MTPARPERTQEDLAAQCERERGPCPFKVGDMVYRDGRARKVLAIKATYSAWCDPPTSWHLKVDGVSEWCDFGLVGRVKP